MDPNDPLLKKRSSCLIDDLYNTPNTSLITFCFEPFSYDSCRLRMQNALIQHVSLDGKDVYTIDRYFPVNESDAIYHFSKKATFSRNSYGSAEAISKGEKPARSMNGKERWQLFSKAPQAIQEVYKLLGWLSYHLQAAITTLPWELCDSASHGSSCFLANLLEESSLESMHWGKHQDCNPEAKISFGIPMLYSQEKKWHPSSFPNGDNGNPWLISIMLYVTDDTFLSDYCMGTVFYDQHEKIALRTNCQHMRLVLFESDIFHSIEESKIPADLKTWRISYVFKLIVNPTQKDQNVKKMLLEQLSHLSIEHLQPMNPERI